MWGGWKEDGKEERKEEGMGCEVIWREREGGEVVREGGIGLT